MYYRPELNLKPEEVLDYLRKSQSDDPALTVEEVLSKHEEILDNLSMQYLGALVPEENKFREVVSGETVKDRPEIQKVLRLIESPRYKALKIVEPQRLTRGDLEEIGRLMKLLKHTNTLVITQQRVYDLRDEYDWDAFERELKRGSEYLDYYKKIQRRGRELSVAQGNFIGSIAPYGYNKTFVRDGKRKCPTLEINPEQADVVRMVFDMYVNQDMGRVNIANRLNELGIKTMKGGRWQQDTIKDMLENVHYIGKVRWNWRKTVTLVEDGEFVKASKQSKVGEYLVYDGKHEAIISEELFAAAEAKRGRNHRAKPTTKIRNPLAGLLFCQCGRAMTMRTYKYHDGAPRLLCDAQTYCKTSSCLYSEIIDRVSEILKQCIADFEMRIKNNDGDSAKLHANLIKRLEAKREELNQKEIAQWEAQAHPDPSKRMPEHVFQILNEKLLKEKEEVRQALCKAYESMPDPVDYTEQLHRFQEALEALHDPERSAKEKNRLLKACIDRITYKRDKAERIKRAIPKKRVTVNGKRVYVRDPQDLEVGARWTNPPIELDVKLKVK
jgi:hypothetical protein